MGTTLNRGTRDAPRWYIKYRDADGRWKRVLSGAKTSAQAKQILRAAEGNVADGRVGIVRADQAQRIGPLMKTWAAGLTNRNAKDDQGRIKKHLQPKWGKVLLTNVRTPAPVLAWIDEQRAVPENERLSEASIRHHLNLLSRFFAWAIEKEHATVNPVRQIPQGRRPRQAQKTDVPWLDDDRVVRGLIDDLPEPIGLMFYIGNRSGLRTGEIAGLRLSDLDWMHEGNIRVRFSYGGPLKEDRLQEGKCKWVPAPDDAPAVLGPWLARRRLAGAKPEDLLFPCPGRRKGSWYRKELIEQEWEKVAHAEGRKLGLTWYQATRHSFTSRNLSRDASLDEVSAALGHSSPVVTMRYYAHFVRRNFSPTLRASLGPKAKGDVVGVAPTGPARTSVTPDES